MRENRLYGSEGGEAKSLPYPYLQSLRKRYWSQYLWARGVLGRDNWDVSDEVRKKYTGDQKPEIPHDRRVGQSAHGPIDPALRRRRGISALTGVQVSGQRRGEDSRPRA